MGQSIYARDKNSITWNARERSFDYRSKSDSEITNNTAINHRTTIQYNTRANKNIYWFKTRRHGLGKSLIRSSIYAKLYLFVFSFSLVNLLTNPELITIKHIGSDFLTDLFCIKLWLKVNVFLPYGGFIIWLYYNRVFLILTKDTNGSIFVLRQRWWQKIDCLN